MFGPTYLWAAELEAEEYRKHRRTVPMNAFILRLARYVPYLLSTHRTHSYSYPCCQPLTKHLPPSSPTPALSPPLPLPSPLHSPLSPPPLQSPPHSSSISPPPPPPQEAGGPMDRHAPLLGHQIHPHYPHPHYPHHHYPHYPHYPHHRYPHFAPSPIPGNGYRCLFADPRQCAGDPPSAHSDILPLTLTLTNIYPLPLYAIRAPLQSIPTGRPPGASAGSK